MPEHDLRIDSIWVKEKALHLGFPLVGITTSEPPPHWDVYHAWIKAGLHADMAYLSRSDAIAKRADPLAVLPQCRSIVVTGTFYQPMAEQPPSEFRVAGYALGEDYHQVLVARMRQLVGAIEARIGTKVEHKVYADTGPLLERELGQRSGLGWIGKNTCLIHPNHGSYFLLAILLLDQPLEPDPPYAYDRCGSCLRCIDACPTKCILPDRTLDARRCISYLTIENKGTIPHDLRHELGNWLFGCDICQQVCPWNLRFGVQPADPAFEMSTPLEQARPGDFLKLSPDKWKQPFKKSPLTRPGRKGLVRNMAVVAGNLTREDLMDDLDHILRMDPDPLTRAHAVWALKQYDDPRSASILRSHQDREQDEQVIRELRLE